MAKDAYYFPHDCNARNDEKLIAVRIRHKAEGYGVYFMLLERLRESADYTSIKDYNMIAFDLRVDSALVKSVVEEFGLFQFTEDGKRFYSESFTRRMRLKDDKSEKARESANRRWNKCDGNTNAFSNVCDRNADAHLKGCNKRKEKEIKETPPVSPMRGSGGGDLFISSGKDTPPPDGVKRNYEALVRNLTKLGVPPDDFNKLCELTNFGETDTPIWTFFRAVEDGKIKMDGIKAPGKYIISILKNG